MRGKKVKELKKPKVMININVQVLNTGEIVIDAPPNVDLVHQVFSQAERIMRENARRKETEIVVPERKIVLAH